MVEGDDSRLRVFTYVTTDKAGVYRAVMRVFMEAKARFELHLRPSDVERRLSAVDDRRLSSEELAAALQQLCEWRNLHKHADTTDVATVEEFYHRPFLYQLTSQGEAAERAIQVYESSLSRPGELKTTALDDIKVLLKELIDLGRSSAPDEGKVHRSLDSLRSRFEELTERAGMFIGKLQRTIDLHALGQGEFLEYKRTLIEYLERFIAELTVATAAIAASVRTIEEEDVGRLLEIAARRDTADLLDATAADRNRALADWQERWRGLARWFIPDVDRPAEVERLRSRARAAVPSLLSAIEGINERRMNRSDRAADFRALACWFAECETERDAHRLFRAAFGLNAARHLRVDQETIEARDQDPVPPTVSWLDAPPLLISPRLRRQGYYTRGRTSTVADRSADKAMLANLLKDEALQIARARQRLATGRLMRLSDLHELDESEFALFLDLLGQALASKAQQGGVVETSSSDGTLQISMAPTDDGIEAEIRTMLGVLRGPDHFITISETFPEPLESRRP